MKKLNLIIIYCWKRVLTEELIALCTMKNGLLTRLMRSSSSSTVQHVVSRSSSSCFSRATSRRNASRSRRTASASASASSCSGGVARELFTCGNKDSCLVNEYHCNLVIAACHRVTLPREHTIPVAVSDCEQEHFAV